MKRRTFCQSTLASAAAATLPCQKLFAAGLPYLADISASVSAISSSGQEKILEAASISELRGSLRGNLLLLGDPGYNNARALWNAMIDKHPALIARCEGAADVVNAINFARDNDLRVSVRGGGHSISGKSVCEGGLMIDMSNMNTVRVDSGSKTAFADGGALEGHIDREASLFNLATTGGIVSHTGAAGLTLGGGYGRVCRKFGLACDNLLGADIVTADGVFRRVSAEEHPDLLWALKGGGGNFGVVTALKYQLHPQDVNVVAGDVIFAWKDAKPVLSFYAEQGNSMPDELNMNLSLLTTADGERRIAVEAVWSGDPAQADKHLEKLRSAGKPVVDNVKAVRYTRFQARGDNSNRHGVRQYMKSSLVSDFSTALVDQLVETYRPNPMSKYFFMQAGGAVARITPSDTAFPHRSAHCNMMRWNAWFDKETPEQRSERIADVRADWALVEKYTRGFYVNLNDDSEQKTQANYGANYRRLVAAKDKYDPTNLLRLNANIKPSNV
jgi:FAD/FMN-containing dehydrogenase